MTKTIRILLFSSLGLSTTGWLLYHHGSRLNVGTEGVDPALWDQSPGDIWLYAGGLLMLVAGSLAVAAVLYWRGSRKVAAGVSIDGGVRNQ